MFYWFGKIFKSQGVWPYPSRLGLTFGEGQNRNRSCVWGRDVSQAARNSSHYFASLEHKYFFWFLRLLSKKFVICFSYIEGSAKIIALLSSVKKEIMTWLILCNWGWAWMVSWGAGACHCSRWNCMGVCQIVDHNTRSRGLAKTPNFWGNHWRTVRGTRSCASLKNKIESFVQSICARYVEKLDNMDKIDKIWPKWIIWTKLTKYCKMNKIWTELTKNNMTKNVANYGQN